MSFRQTDFSTLSFLLAAVVLGACVRSALPVSPISAGPSPGIPPVPAVTEQETAAPVTATFEATATRPPESPSPRLATIEERKSDALWLIYAGLGGKARATSPGLEGGSLPEISMLSTQGSLLPYSPAPAGGRAAFLVQSGELDLQLWILKLPEQVVEARIALLSQAARLALQEGRATAGGPNVPAALEASLLDRENLGWSEDGRYLAFVGALDGASPEPYVFDTQGGEVHRLPSELERTAILGWSPDGRRVLYMTIPGQGTGATPQTYSVWESDPAGGQVKRLYSQELDANLYREHILGWISSSEFVVETQVYEGPANNLRLVDASSGQVRSLYRSFTRGASLDAGTQTLFASLGEIQGQGTEEPAGLYRLDIPGGDFSLITPGIWSGVNWYPSIQQIASWGEMGLVTFTPAGEKRFEFQGDITPSPDGKWLLAADPQGYGLYSSNGDLVRQIPFQGSGAPLWLPDASGFYLAGEGLYRFMVEDGWQEQVVDGQIWPGSPLFFVSP